MNQNQLTPKILIVDDDSTNRLVLKGLLEKISTIEMAVDGFEALEKFKEAINANEKFDIILLDIMMPNMNGQEVLTQIRDIEQVMGVVAGQGVKVVMVTALDDEANIFESHISGCEGFIVKPVTKAIMLDKIKELGF